MMGGQGALSFVRCQILSNPSQTENPEVLSGACVLLTIVMKWILAAVSV